LAFGLGACDVTIALDLPRAEAELWKEALNRRGIAVSVLPSSGGEPDHVELSIADTAVARAVQVLRERTIPKAEAEEPALALIPTRQAQQKARERAISTQIARALEQKPGVVRADVSVQLSPPEESLGGLLQAKSAPSALVLIVRAPDAALDEQQLQALVELSVPGLERSKIVWSEHIADRPNTNCAELSHVGALTVTSASASTLKRWFGASLCVHMLMAAALLYVLHRKDKARRA
jgi:type III secretory pathway lipoprotein EscJ